MEIWLLLIVIEAVVENVKREIIGYLQTLNR